MKKENVLVIAIICIAVAGVMIYQNFREGVPGTSSGSQGSDTSGIAWQGYGEGLERARTQEKPVFLYFHAEWCTYCTKLKKTTFKEEEVIRYLNDNFVSISVDTDQNRELATEWKVKGLPTMWFLKPDGTKISNIPGYVDKDQLMPILKYIHTGSYDKMSFSQFLKTI